MGLYRSKKPTYIYVTVAHAVREYASKSFCLNITFSDKRELESDILYRRSFAKQALLASYHIINLFEK